MTRERQVLLLSKPPNWAFGLILNEAVLGPRPVRGVGHVLFVEPLGGGERAVVCRRSFFYAP
jgi:hypothetical protein